MKLKICVSDRCFFPKSAFESSKTIVKLAKSLGYESVEFHPTWAVWFEMTSKGKLSAETASISSFHVSWREDGKYFGLNPLRVLFNPNYRVFPFGFLGIKTLQKLEEKYGKPVVVHWPEDFSRYKKSLLELQWPLKMNLKEVEKAIKEKQIAGVVIDTGKLIGWLKDQNEEEEKVLKTLLPHIGEVHFRFRSQDDVNLLSGRGETESARLMKRLVKMGYCGRVVVEMGWPEEGALEALRQEGLVKIHKRIVNFLQTL